MKCWVRWLMRWVGSFSAQSSPTPSRCSPSRQCTRTAAAPSSHPATARVRHHIEMGGAAITAGGRPPIFHPHMTVATAAATAWVCCCHYVCNSTRSSYHTSRTDIGLPFQELMKSNLFRGWWCQKLQTYRRCAGVGRVHGGGRGAQGTAAHTV